MSARDALRAVQWLRPRHPSRCPWWDRDTRPRLGFRHEHPAPMGSRVGNMRRPTRLYANVLVPTKEIAKCRPNTIPGH